MTSTQASSTPTPSKRGGKRKQPILWDYTTEKEQRDLNDRGFGLGCVERTSRRLVLSMGGHTLDDAASLREIIYYHNLRIQTKRKQNHAHKTAS